MVIMLIFSLLICLIIFLSALRMHNMNREMKALRQQMEQKLRKELVTYFCRLLISFVS
jgi:high-affinity Fe2+/Pb2+ permease